MRTRNGQCLEALSVHELLHGTPHQSSSLSVHLDDPYEHEVNSRSRSPRSEQGDLAGLAVSLKLSGYLPWART